MYGSGDYDQLDAFSGLDVAVAAVTATVVELSGAPVTLRDDGYVDYDSDSLGYPRVAAESVLVVEEFIELQDDASGLLAGLHGDDAPRGTLEMWHSNGYFEVGRSYVFFVAGSWPGDVAVLYAHDPLSDCPAAGFSNSRLDEVIERMQLAQDDDSEILLDLVIQLSKDLRQDLGGRPISLLLEAAYG